MDSVEPGPLPNGYLEPQRSPDACLPAVNFAIRLLQGAPFSPVAQRLSRIVVACPDCIVCGDKAAHGLLPMNPLLFHQKQPFGAGRIIPLFC